MKRVLKFNLVSLYATLISSIIFIIITRLIVLRFFTNTGYTAINIAIILSIFMTYGIPLFINSFIDDKALVDTRGVNSDKDIKINLKNSIDMIKNKFNKKALLILSIISVLCVLSMHVFRSFIFNFLFGFCKNTMAFLTFDHSHTSLSLAEFIIAFISIAIISPVFEEFFFRGLLIKKFNYLPKTIIILSSVFLFTLSHNNIQQILIAIPLGIICAAIMSRTSGLFYCIIIHSFANLISILNININDTLFSYEYAIKYNELTTARSNSFFELMILILLGLLLYLCIKALPQKSDNSLIEKYKTELGNSKKYFASHILHYIAACCIFAFFVSTFIRLG